VAIDDKGRENSVKIEIIAPSREKSSKDKGGKRTLNTISLKIRRGSNSWTSEAYK
jgi:hypothetical protein